MTGFSHPALFSTLLLPLKSGMDSQRFMLQDKAVAGNLECSQRKKPRNQCYGPRSGARSVARGVKLAGGAAPLWRLLLLQWRLVLLRNVCLSNPTGRVWRCRHVSFKPNSILWATRRVRSRRPMPATWWYYGTKRVVPCTCELLGITPRLQGK